MVYINRENEVAALNPRTRGHVRRAAAAVVMTTAIGMTLSGCSLAEQFGPKPNKELATLYQDARNDAEVFAQTNPGLAGLRADQAEELHAEIIRVCGFRQDGTVPKTCDDNAIADQVASTPMTLELSEDPSPSYSSTIISAPESSRALLVAQATDYAVQQGRDDVTTIAAQVKSDEDAAKSLNNENEQQILTTLAEFEAGAVYGLEASQAFVGDEAVAGILEDACARLAALNALLTVPVVPAASYEVTGEPPTDDTTGWAFVHRIQAEAQKAWTDAATKTQAPALLTMYIAGAANARS